MVLLDLRFGADLVGQFIDRGPKFIGIAPQFVEASLAPAHSLEPSSFFRHVCS